MSIPFDAGIQELNCVILKRGWLTRRSYNTDYEANAIGKGFPNPYNPTGPTINAIIDNRHGHENPLDGYVIEEGAIPSALAPFLQAMLETMPGSKSPKGDSPLERVRSGMARLGSFVLGPYLQRGALDNTQVYLVMSHDSKFLKTDRRGFF